MDSKDFSKKLVFFLAFSILVLIASRINFSALVGAENQFFTLFQFFGPITGAILGPVIGVASVLFAQLGNLVASGSEFSPLNLLRVLPMLFAAYYFGSKRKSFVIVPLICIFLFILHPVGRHVWVYSLFWTIPIAARFFQKHLFVRSLGSTFTAHAIGGVIWIWTVPMPAEAWIGLIPVVIVERLLFASGISLSYMISTTVLAKMENVLPDFVILERNYSLSSQIARLRKVLFIRT